MDGLISWLQGIGQSGVTVLNVIIGLAAIVFGGLSLIKGIKDLQSKKMSDGLKYVGIAVIIFLIASVGVMGLARFANTIAPDDSVIPRTNILN